MSGSDERAPILFRLEFALTLLILGARVLWQRWRA